MNRATSHDRPWPIMSAAQADDEIARLRDQNRNLKKENKTLRSAVRSLLQAVVELQEVIGRAGHAENQKTAH